MKKKFAKWQKITLLALACIIVFVTLIAAFTPESKEKVSSPNPQQITTFSPEVSLAMLDAKEKVKASDIRVKVIKTYLDSLSLFYDVSNDTVADYISHCQSIFQDKGYDLKCRALLQSLLLFSKTMNTQNIKFKDAIILYSMFLDKNKSDLVKQ